MNREAHPFIIWTNQRTGGTNLAQALLERDTVTQGLLAGTRCGTQWSVCGRVLEHTWQLHEPFNAGDPSRLFGGVTDEWLKGEDLLKLENRIEEILAVGVSFKHCVEMVPEELNQLLRRLAGRHGYRHVFLYRRSALDRLLSLHFAGISGIWGRHFYSRDNLDASIFERPLPVKSLVEHEAFCVERLQRAWDDLLSKGAWQRTICFEDIFDASRPESGAAIIVALLESLGLTNGRPADHRLAEKLIFRGEQGSRPEYRQFTGIDALVAGLGNMTPPDFRRPCFKVQVEFAGEENPEIVHCEIDRLPDVVESGELFPVSGIVVPRSNERAWRIEREQGVERIPVRWRIRSPKIEAQFDGLVHASNARFLDAAVVCDPGVPVLYSLTDDQSHLPLLRLDFLPIGSRRSRISETSA